jgi:hypothetical protein
VSARARCPQLLGRSPPGVPSHTLPHLSARARNMPSADVCVERSRSPGPGRIAAHPTSSLGPIRAPAARHPKSILRESTAAPGPQPRLSSEVITPPPPGPPASLRPPPLGAATAPAERQRHAAAGLGNLREHMPASEVYARSGYLSVVSSPEQPVRTVSQQPQRSGKGVSPAALRSPQAGSEVASLFFLVEQSLACPRGRI